MNCLTAVRFNSHILPVDILTPVKGSEGPGTLLLRGNRGNALVGHTFGAPAPCLCHLVWGAQLQLLSVLVKDEYSAVSPS